MANSLHQNRFLAAERRESQWHQKTNADWKLYPSKIDHMGGCRNAHTPKWMVYNGKSQSTTMNPWFPNMSKRFHGPPISYFCATSCQIFSRTSHLQDDPDGPRCLALPTGPANSTCSRARKANNNPCQAGDRNTGRIQGRLSVSLLVATSLLELAQKNTWFTYIQRVICW